MDIKTIQKNTLTRTILDIQNELARIKRTLQGQPVSLAQINTADLDLAYMRQSNNLSDIVDAAIARENLGLGSMSLEDSTDYFTAAALVVLLAGKLTKSGDTMTGAIGYPVATTGSVSFTLNSNHHTLLCNAVSNDITVNLPDASSCTGRIYFIKCIDATHAVTIEPNGVQTIDGLTNIVLRVANDFAIIQSDGSNWWLFSEAPQTVS